MYNFVQTYLSEVYCVKTNYLDFGLVFQNLIIRGLILQNKAKAGLDLLLPSSYYQSIPDM